MRIEWAVGVQGVENQLDGLTTLRGVGVDTVVVSDADFPVDVPIMVAVNLVIRYDEFPDDPMHPAPHQIAWRIFGPDMASVATGATDRFGISGRSPEHYEGWEGHNIQALPLTVPAPDPGVYTVELRLDDQEPVVVVYQLRRADLEED